MEQGKRQQKELSSQDGVGVKMGLHLTSPATTRRLDTHYI